MANVDCTFGPLQLLSSSRTAVHAGMALHLTPKAFDLLRYLALHGDRAVGKAELMAALWPGVEVEESNLTQTVFMVRRALEGAGSSHEWIATIPRAGYRFTPPEGATTAQIVAQRLRARRPLIVALGTAAVLVAAIASAAWLRPWRVRGRDAEDRVPMAATRNAGDARRAYLAGREALEARTPASLLQATASFRAAVTADPTFAEAYAGLAAAYNLSGVFGAIPRREAFQRAIDAAAHALTLDPSLADAHTAVAFAQHVWQKRWAEAESRYLRAIALDPNLAQARHWYALLLDSLARPDEALREIRAAAALAPSSPAIASDFGMILAHHGAFDQALSQFRAALDLDPSYADACQEMGWAYAFTGRYAEAEASFARAQTLFAPRASTLAGIGYVQARSGRASQARETIQAIEAAAMPDAGLRDALQAQVLLGLGEHDRALDLLLRAHPEGEPNLRVGRIYDPVRNDPRFQELLRRSGLQ